MDTKVESIFPLIFVTEVRGEKQVARPFRPRAVTDTICSIVLVIIYTDIMVRSCYELY